MEEHGDDTTASPRVETEINGVMEKDETKKEVMASPTGSQTGEPTSGSREPETPAAVAAATSSGTNTGHSEAASDANKSTADSGANIKKLIGSGKLSPDEVKAVRGLVNEHAVLKVKVDRLKGLLGRSAKAQREAKVELEVSQKRLEQALRDVQRLKEKVDHLSSRPTHSKSLFRDNAQFCVFV